MWHAFLSDRPSGRTRRGEVWAVDLDLIPMCSERIIQKEDNYENRRIHLHKTKKSKFTN